MLKLATLTIGLAVCLATASGQTFTYIPQVADGDGWSTTIVLTNTTATTASVSMSFFKETTGGATTDWTLPLVASNVNPVFIALPGGSSLFLHTTGLGATTTVGWGMMIAPAGVGVYSIFTSQLPGKTAQSGTAEGAANTGRLLAPFDNTNKQLTAIAFANTGASPITISANFRTASGSVTSGTLGTLPGQGHTSFLLSSQFPALANQSGLAEFYASSGNFAIIALQVNATGGFTTAPFYNGSGSPIITGSSTGGGTTTSAGFTVFKTTTGGSFPSSNELQEFVGGSIARYSPAEWTAQTAGQSFPPCTVYTATYTTVAPNSPDQLLDAGTITVNGPGVSGTVLSKINGGTGPTYLLQPANGTLQLGGTYSLSASGGADVAAFNSPSVTFPTAFSVTNWNSITSINRSAALPVTWTETGSGSDQVAVTIVGAAISGSGVNSVSIACVAPASAGALTVPQAALALLPVVSTGNFAVEVAPGNLTSHTGSSLTPNLVAGGTVNYGAFVAMLGTSKVISIQ